MSIEEMYILVDGYDVYWNDIDADAVEGDDPCPSCGSHIEYRGFKRGKSYRAFYICLKCNNAEEFF